MHRRVNLVPSPPCTCGTEDPTTEHILQKMSIIPTSQRTDMVRQMLYGMKKKTRVDNLLYSAGWLIRVIKRTRRRLYWSPSASLTSIYKPQVIQNATLRAATGCTQYTNIQHLHDETLILPTHEHLHLHRSQYKQTKTTIFNNGRYTTNIPTYTSATH